MTVRNAFRTVIMYSHYGQSLWTVIKTVLFFIMTVQNDCPFCEMKISSHKNVRPLFIVKSEFLGYNGPHKLTKSCRKQIVTTTEMDCIDWPHFSLDPLL